MRLLIAYDGSPAANAAITLAGALFAPAEAVVAYVRDPELDAIQGAMARSRLSDEAMAKGFAEIERCACAHATTIVADGEIRARAAGLQPRQRIVPGTRPWRELIRVAEAERADLIVTGTNDHLPIGRVFLGSTAASLLHRAGRPVLVVPAGAGSPAGPVVVAYDDSVPAEQALRFACTHVRAQPLHIAYIWHSPARHSVDVDLLRCLPSDTVRDFVGDIDAAYERAASDVGRRGVDLARSLGVTAEARVIESARTPWRGIVELATAEHARLIVTGAEHAGFASRLGSVSSGLVHHAAGPILVVPHHAAAERAAPAVNGATELRVS